jgi:cytoskeletal protein CcmA (bactofilin family)
MKNFLRRITYVSAVLSVGFFLVGASTVNAESVIRTGDAVSIADDQKIDGDFYSAAGKFNLSGSVSGDAIVASSQVTINGSVEKDAVLFGGTVDVYGTIGDDLRIVSGETTIAKPVLGDVLVVGGVLNILSSASVSGDVILLTGQAIIEGSVGGDVLGWSDSLRIDAPVAGDVSVTVSSLTLGEKANISGSVQYVSRELAVQAQGATIEGDLQRNDPVLPAPETSLRTALVPVLVILFSVLSWYLISRKTLVQVTNLAISRSFKPVAFGFAAIILAPFAIVILSVSVLGMLVGITLFFLYALLLMLGIIALPALIGQAMMSLFNQSKKQFSLITLLVGVIGVVIIALLPLIGFYLLLGAVLLAMGAMIELLLQSARK